MQPSTVIPGVLPESEARLRARFHEEVSLVPGGDRVARCLQCGACTGSCPVSYAMDISPRQVIALYRAGRIEEILRSRTIWICASCYMCTARCPQSIKITDLLYALRRTAMEAKLYPDRFPVYRLAGEFAANVGRHGRNHELSLMLRYYLKVKPTALLRMIPLGWALFRRGRVALWPRRIQGRKEIRAILRAAGELKLPLERAPAEYDPSMAGYRAVG